MSSTAINPSEWVSRYSDYLFNYTITRVNDRELAQDLISETFLAALKAKDNFKGEAHERTWLISILKRKIIDYYRKSNSAKGKAEVRMPDYQDEEGSWLEQRVADPYDKTAEDNLENTELSLAIMDCLALLPPKQAQIFKLKTIDEFDTEVICNDLKITASNLWVMIHRARKAMMDCMKKSWLD
ncbi:sigma-70 family RNA polymerase sigma factor [Gangjinia marincola]|uniref:Sigma-70 family RNA polymerase sigma factor n=1 Tax=Gangjinia marincola TaxID=578463 RepID=A0ABN1MKV4_9FLAO